ncbi:MAG: sugar phosphate nucleotidyltransferase [Blastocatellia bacterium]
MYDCFISYSSKDGLDLAKSVAAILEKTYLMDVFLAEENQGTAGIDSKVKEAITQSGRFLVLYTPGAVTSEWVKGETAIALDMQKNMIVCRSRDVSRESLPVRLVEKEHIVFTIESELLRLLAELGEREWGIPLIIPAGGTAGGLYPLNIGMPKILLPVEKKPLLHHIVDKLDATVFSKAIILTNHFFEMIEYHVSSLKTNVPLKCIRTSAPTLPSALKEISPATTFMVHYSDIIIDGDFDWRDFLAHHKHHRNLHGVIGTLMASDKYKLPVGRIKTGPQQLITDFAEKPQRIEAVGYAINMAVSIFEPEFLVGVEETDRSLYGDTLKRAMEQNKKFCIYSHDRWRHIQTLGDWYEVQSDYFRTEEGLYALVPSSRD